MSFFLSPSHAHNTDTIKLTNCVGYPSAMWALREEEVGVNVGFEELIISKILSFSFQGRISR